MSAAVDVPAIVPTELSVATSPTESAVDAVCVRMAYEALVPRAVATTLTAAAIAWIVSRSVPTPRLVAWVAFVAVVNVARVVLAKRFQAIASDDAAVMRFRPGFVVTSALAAGAWGVLIAVTGFSTELEVVTPILLAIGGMMAGGAHTASTPGVMKTSMLLALTPISLHMLASGDPALRAFLIPVAMHVLTTVNALNVNYKEVRETIVLRYQNVALVDQLTAEKARELEARREAERANVEKSRFLAAASHDVRQPLHALGLFVDALKGRPLERDAQRLVHSIELAHGSLASLHEGLLSVSRLDAGAITAVEVPFAARGLLERLEAEAAPRARERGLGFRIVARELTLRTDPELLLRLLRNLVANALQYTREGRVLVTLRRRGDHALVQVWDTGIGISQDEQAKVFDELYQVGNRARDREQGLGLGLAIVRRLAGLLGTAVTVRSTPGRGSVFSLELPLAAQSDAVWLGATSTPEADEGASPAFAAGQLALAVDDDPLARAALAETLTRWGYEVVAAQSAEEALEHAEAVGDVAVLVTDLWLPGLSGLELARALADRPGLVRVVISGDTDPEISARVRREGIGFVPKPVRANSLRTAILGARVALSAPRG